MPAAIRFAAVRRWRICRRTRPIGPAGDPGPPPDNGIVGSADPGVVTTPDGWVLTVAATNETQLPIAPLTTATSSREYLVGGTFTGTVTGKGKTTLSGGTLEAGYQVGCGIELGQVRLIGSGRRGTSVRSSLTGGIMQRHRPALGHHRDPPQAGHGVDRSRWTRSRSRRRPCV